ncbi:MAG TPA: alpha/beta hydrolase [Thermoanaerobaculia bacterium]|jgi:pimeloyl-ACP methyl ester carboxylesterase|nr:alpha/beta hydrolase [Thermoanaerobaculia bacterium]
MNLETEIRHRTLATNGVRLHVVEAGPEDGPLLLLLHGYPEFWYGWRHQIGPLVAAGFRVLIPDQRGYNLSGKPRRVSSYNLDILARDAVGLIDAAGADKACVVGHDWGGFVGWWLGVKHPQRLERLAVLNIPHPVVFEYTLWHSSAQRKRSNYILFFQLPWLPERIFSRNDFAYAEKALRVSSRPGTFSDEDVARYKEAWSKPHAVRSMIHWYRAAFRSQPRPPKNPRVPVPTLLIWGTQDRFLGQEMAPASLALCDNGRLELIPEATHWVQHEEPERVNRLLLDFLV